LQNIFTKIGKDHFKNAIELGCDRGTHYSNMLKKYCDCLIGVDVLEEQDVKNLDKYIRVDPTGNLENVLWEIPDKSIDCAFIINFTGMGVNRDWDGQLVMDNSRAGNYFFENNFGRVLRSGGFVFWIEWEAYPEKRFGKLRLSDIEAKIDGFYRHSEIPGFKCILKGFSATHMGPYIVYQENKADNR